MFLGEIKYKVGKDHDHEACFSTERVDERDRNGDTVTVYPIRLKMNFEGMGNPVYLINNLATDPDRVCLGIIQESRIFADNFDETFQKLRQAVISSLDSFVEADRINRWDNLSTAKYGLRNEVFFGYRLMEYSTDQPTLRLFEAGLVFYYKYVKPVGIKEELRRKHACYDDSDRFIISEYYATTPYLAPYVMQYIDCMENRLALVRDVLKEVIDTLTPIVGENHEQ